MSGLADPLILRIEAQKAFRIIPRHPRLGDLCGGITSFNKEYKRNFSAEGIF